MNICAAGECERETRSARALYCEMHYYRLRRTGKLTARPWAARTPGPCSVGDCENPAQDVGMCFKHAARMRRHGDPRVVIHQRDRQLPCGSANPRWAGDGITYGGMHLRVRNVLGSARDHLCVDCGDQARQWSYDHDDPGERHAAEGAYSLNIGHYLPRCVPCHKKFDLSVKANGPSR